LAQDHLGDLQYQPNFVELALISLLK
jgi:hypothetical protein